MEERSLNNMMKAFNSKTEDTWLMNVMQLNMDCIITLQKQKAKATLRSLAWFKIFAIALGILWVWFLSLLMIGFFSPQNIIFLVSVGTVALITAVAIIVYINHVFLIRQINNSDTIVNTQLKLAKLQTSTLQITRILFLQTPFYSTWFLSYRVLMQAGTLWLTIQICVTAMLTFLSIWLYRNISYKNAGKKWFKILFNTPEWTSVIKAIAFIQEIDDFKSDR